MTLQDLIFRLKNTEGNLIIMVGPPLSGKSTLIKKISDYCEIISRDDIVMELGDGLNYQDSFKTVSQKHVSAKLRSKISEAGKSDRNVAIDMTNLKPKGRRAHLKNFPTHTKIALVISDLTLEELMERNEKRYKEEDKFIPEFVIKQMMSNYTFPTKEEGFDYIIKYN